MRDKKIKRYLILKEGEYEYLWDSKKNKMYGKQDGSYIGELKSDLIMLSKFCPFAEIVKETDKKPNVEWFVAEKERGDKLMGKTK